MKYQRHIDGLRAIAVMAVILFHAGVPSFGGGFCGVDIFFVISGYLITSLLLREFDAGKFSIASFYIRRARRILPALFAVLSMCVPVAWLTLLPADMKHFSESLIATLLFVSNIYSWRHEGYFDLVGERNPLLHMWSLAVEEQYYLFFPLLLLVAGRAKRKLNVILVLLLLVSLASAQWGSIHKPIFTFFLLPTRGFELLIGALAATHSRTGPVHDNRSVCEIASCLGLALVAYSIHIFTKDLPFPGLYALVPTVGAALLIIFAGPETLAGKILGSRPLVAVGLFSYSIYLWHQPLFAFARILSPYPIGGEMIVVLTLSSIGLGYLSWRFVEQPFRKAATPEASWRFLAGTFIISAMLLAVGIYGSLTNGNVVFGYLTRLSDAESKVAAYYDYDFRRTLKVGTCLLGSDQTFTDFDSKCTENSSDADKIFVWGDSYAASLAGGLRIATGGNVNQYTYASCPPLMQDDTTGQVGCGKMVEDILQRIAVIKPDLILLHAKWIGYGAPTLTQRMEKTIKQIRLKSPTSRVVVVGSVPQWYSPLPAHVIRRGASLIKEIYLQNPMVDDLHVLDSRVKAGAVAAGATYFSALNHFCKDSNCLAVTNSQGIYELTTFDDGHLTEGGAVYLAAQILQALNK